MHTTKKCELTKGIVAEIIALHGEVKGLLETSLKKAIRIGELLIEQKAVLKHGEFGSWIKANLPFTDRTARSYMNCYQNRKLLKTESVSDLSGAYKMLQGTSEPVKRKSLFQQVFDLQVERLMTERYAGEAMQDMNKILTPARGSTIVGCAEPFTVFHIEFSKEGNLELEVCKLHENKKGYDSKKFPVSDLWWEVQEHIKFSKITAIWAEPDVMLTAEEDKRITETSGDGVWDIITEIILQRNRENLTDKGFISAAHKLYDSLMEAYGRLCDAYDYLEGGASCGS